MSEDKLLTVEVEGREIQMAFADNDMWFTQSSLAKLFETTRQNVNIHISNLSRYMDVDKSSRAISVVQTEGKRSVCRKAKAYCLEIAHAVGIRAQRYAELNCLMGIASEHGVLRDYYRVTPVLERDFAKGFSVLLKDITKIERQVQLNKYRVDFYLPEISLAVEFDELYHEGAAQKSVDRVRQRNIEELCGVTFIRVCEGKEFEALNLILRYLIQVRGQ
jgi:very-short-patch-repair endonuclease